MSEPRLAAMKPEDEWVDKFYAALSELWIAVKGTEITAMPEPPHIVMARLIEDVAWAGRAQDDGLDPWEIEFALARLLNHHDYLQKAECEDGAEARRVLALLRAAPPLHDPQEPER